MAALPKTDDTWLQHYNQARDWATRHCHTTCCVAVNDGGLNYRLRLTSGPDRAQGEVVCIYYGKARITIGGRTMIGFASNLYDANKYVVISDMFNPGQSAEEIGESLIGKTVALIPLNDFGLVSIPSQFDSPFQLERADKKTANAVKLTDTRSTEGDRSVHTVKLDDIPCAAAQLDHVEPTNTTQSPTIEEVEKAQLMLRAAADWDRAKQAERQRTGLKFLHVYPEQASWDKYYAEEVKKANDVLARHKSAQEAKAAALSTSSKPKPYFITMPKEVQAKLYKHMFEPTAATAPAVAVLTKEKEKIKVTLTETCNYSSIAVRALLAKHGKVYGKPAWGSRILKDGTHSLYNRMTLYVFEKREWQLSFNWLAKSLDYILPTYHSVLTIDRKANTFELHHVPEYLQLLQADIRKEITEAFKIEVANVRHTQPRNYFEEHIA